MLGLTACRKAWLSN